MNAVGPPSSFFTDPAHWRWLIVLYFFIGGLAGGCYFLAALLDFFGGPLERRLARWGYLVAFPAVVASGILLILDLGRPERFWHMLVQSETWRPMVKYWSPISVGSWGLAVFGLLSFVAFLAALGEMRRPASAWARRLRPPSLLGTVITALGGVAAFFMAGYTGVLLAVTNRPIWSDTPLLGLVFLVSAASTSAALLLLLAYRRPWGALATAGLRRFDAAALVLELIVLVALVASLGGLARVWLDAWGAVLAVGVVLAGILVPLLLHWRPRLVGPDLSVPVAAALVLIGGFLLRVVIVLSAEGLGLVG